MSDRPRTAYRILDASANRATEGLRTIEEFLRMGKDDRERTAVAKTLRHDLATALSRLDRSQLLQARDTETDIGTDIQTRQEYERTSIADVVTAAAARVAQALRVLEEYGKTVDPEFARQIETIRYRAYTWLRDVEWLALGDNRSRRLGDARLYLLIDADRDTETFLTRIRRLADAGVDVFQLRDKSASDRVLFERASAASVLCRELGVLFLVNDRADIAGAADADGVHVGQDELPIHAARRVIGNDRLIGVSTHDLEQVHQAIADGADYIGCGPTFPSQTKSFDQHPGTAFLRSVHQSTRATPRPAFAIGGIGQNNLDEVLECGFHRIAVTAAINAAADPVAAARELRIRLNESSSPSVPTAQ